MIGLLLALLLPAAAQAAPAGLSGELIGRASPTGIAVSSDERLIAVSHRSDGGLSVFDRTSFLDGPQTPDVCSTARDVVFAPSAASTHRFYVACDGGEVYRIDADASELPAALTVSRAIDVGDAETDVLDLSFASGGTFVHAVVQGDGFFSTARIGLSDDSVQTALTTDVFSTAINADLGEDGSPWVVTLTSNRLAWVSRQLDVYAVSLPLVEFGKLSDVAVSNAAAQVVVADETAGALFSLVAADAPGDATEFAAGLVDAPSVVTWGGTATAPLLWVGETGGAVSLLSASGAFLAGYSLDGVNPAGIAPAPVVDGSAYIAGQDNHVHLASDRAFVTELDVDRDAVAPGEDFTLTFAANQDGDWDLRVGGDLDEDSGTSLGSGTLVADEAVEVTLSSDDLPAEGDNRLMLFVDGDDLGNDSILVNLDGPPGEVTAVSADAADERLDLTWTAPDAPDLATFRVYLSDAAFTADSLPSFTVTVDDQTVSYPRDVDAGEAREQHSLSVEGLANGTPYYLALRAVDAGGQVGPLSTVVSGTPARTCGAAECAGESPGCNSCSASVAAAAPGVGLLLLGLLGFLLKRR